MPPKGSVSAKIRSALAYYVGEAHLDGPKACRMAGYSYPHSTWNRIKQNHGQLVEEAEQRLQAKLEMEWPEVLAGIADVGRDRKHKDRLKALELLAKIHGKLDPKLSISVDRSTVEQHLCELLNNQAVRLAAGDALPQLGPGTPDDSEVGQVVQVAARQEPD